VIQLSCTNQSLIVRTKWIAIGPESSAPTTAHVDATRAFIDSDEDHLQPWRERPLRTGAGRFPARVLGSLTPCFLL
jgi:hypothetical protein